MTWHRSDCLAADRMASAVNLGTVSEIRDAIFGCFGAVSAPIRPFVFAWGLGRITGSIGFKVCLGLWEKFSKWADR